MRKFNLEMGIVTAFLPHQGLLFLLPAGCYFYLQGSLSAGNFIPNDYSFAHSDSTILVASYMDDLRKSGLFLAKSLIFWKALIWPQELRELPKGRDLWS